MAINLCMRCRDLNLSYELFKVNNNFSPDGRDHPARTTQQPINLGTMTRIRDSAASCNLCALVAHSVHDLPLDERQDDVTCHLYWEVDGRTAGREGSKVNCTRRLRIGWNDERLKPYEAHLILAAPAEYDKSDIDYPSRVDRNSQFLGRRIGSSASKRNLTREFLRLCERDHKGCSGNLGIEDPFAQTLREPYFGVIDIENQQLVPLRYHETIEGDRIEFDPYATVSYVWGDRASHRHSTRKANVQHRLKPGGLAEVIECLPTALRQCLDLVHGMGIYRVPPTAATWLRDACLILDSGSKTILGLIGISETDMVP
ncbi:hypothetical protein F5Y08DRAFT_306456 [Xylaria arbuscula]|nr:hypothetical protein F5Y08DRAFT_306456 [Xylaria arbuscula]